MQAATKLKPHALKGDAFAQFILAHMWFNLAAAQGNDIAVANRDLVAKKMTAEQISQSQKLAQDCIANNYKNCLTVASPLKQKTKN